MKIDFEAITIEDKSNVLNKIENIRSLSLKEIKEKLLELSKKVFAITNSEKEVYAYLILLIEYNVIREVKWEEISETTLKVLIKDLNIRNLYSLNAIHHTIKLNAFESFLNGNIERPKINMINSWLDLNNQIIHIDNLIKLQQIYNFKYVDAVVIVDDVKKIFKLTKYYEDDFICSGTSSIYCFCKNQNECDYLDFSLSKSESNTKFRFFINSIHQQKKSFKLNQEKAYSVYEKILDNPNLLSNNEIFKIKLKNHNPLYCKNIEDRSIFFNDLEN